MSGCHESKISSLYDICLYFCMDNVSILSETQKGMLRLQSHIILPSKVCEDFIKVRKILGYVIDDDFMGLFSDPQRTSLQKVDLKYSVVTNDAIISVLQHKVLELDISDNREITATCIELINQKGLEIRTLVLGNTFVCHVIHQMNMLSLEKECVQDRTDLIKLQNCKKLQKLVICEETLITIETLVKPLNSLTHLDISYCKVKFEHMDCIEELLTLQTLKLAGVEVRDLTLSCKKISKLINLRILDLSQNGKEPVMYEHATVNLKFLVDKLTHLVILNLSGTNLSGTLENSTSNDEAGDTNLSCSIPGLEGRYFTLLGLWNCADAACHRPNIPAKQVAGEADDEQIVTALNMCLDCLEHQLPHVSKMLSALYDSLQNGTLEPKYDWPVYKILVKILTDMNHLREKASYRYANENNVFEDSSAVLNICVLVALALFKLRLMNRLSIENRRNLLRALLGTLNPDSEIWLAWTGYRRYRLLSLFHLSDFNLSLYKMYLHILLDAISTFKDISQHLYTSHIEYILGDMNYLCVNGTDKLYKIDNLTQEIIKEMLDLVSVRLQKNSTDNVASAWVILWDLTDGRPENAVYLIEHNCIQTVLGTLKANISDVDILRHNLVEPQILTMCCDLLDQDVVPSDNAYLVSYILAYSLCDNPSSWNFSEPSPEQIEQKLKAAICKVDPSVPQSFKYRTLKPIVYLLPSKNILVQYWAIWTLQLFTQKSAEDYFPMLEEEGGINLMRELLEDSSLSIKNGLHIIEILEEYDQIKVKLN